jgi:UDP-2-acetamido-3-amino-2,3-dideoxy-glucuronate N-acetyltransferase
MPHAALLKTAGPLPLTRTTLVRFPCMQAEARRIVPMEAATGVPFDVRRVFTIRATRAGLVGGRHAHRRCHQLIVATEGVCEVVVIGDHAGDRAEWLLDSPDVGLWIPPSLWGEQRYLSNPVGLMVLCDRPYEADDYIRDYETYIRFRSGAE